MKGRKKSKDIEVGRNIEMRSEKVGCRIAGKKTEQGDK